MGMSNRAVPDSYRQLNNARRNFWLDHPNAPRQRGASMPPANPSFADYQQETAWEYGVEPPKEEADDPMKGIGEPLSQEPNNNSPNAQNYLQSLRDLLIHQDRPTEFK